MPDANESLSVSIVGGGIAGLAAALRLAERGFAVTIYEKGPLLGGNLSGVLRDSVYYDVYPHMFAAWFHNFWKLAEDIGLSRERDFERRSECAFLRRNDFPHFHVGKDIGSFQTALENISSGILSLPQMFLVDYTVLDAIARGDLDPRLDFETLNDFVVNRPYSTPGVTRFFDETVNNIWSINSYLSSARAYQRYAKYQFREPSPLCWVLKGNSFQTLVEPLRKALERANCRIRTRTEVTGATVRQGRVAEISASELIYDEAGLVVGRQELKPEPVDNLIIASPPAGLSGLVFTKAETGFGSKSDGRSIVNLLPRLASIRRLESATLPVLYVAFRRQLPDLPHFYVAMLESKYSLTFVRIEELSGPQKTVLAIAASDFDAIPIKFAIERARRAANGVAPQLWKAMSEAPELTEAAMLVLTEFADYVPITVGSRWGDPNSDVDWDNTFFQPNLDQQIFINQVGSQRWQTEANYPEISNLYFAGNTCANPITITTVESAVYSGLQAARALVARQSVAAKMKPVEIVDPKGYPTALLIAWLVMLSPYAAFAKVWADADEWRNGMSGGGASPGAPAGARIASQWAQNAEAAVADWWGYAESVWSQFMR